MAERLQNNPGRTREIVRGIFSLPRKDRFDRVANAIFKVVSPPLVYLGIEFARRADEIDPSVALKPVGLAVATLGIASFVGATVESIRSNRRLNRIRAINTKGGRTPKRMKDASTLQS